MKLTCLRFNPFLRTFLRTAASLLLVLVGSAARITAQDAAPNISDGSGAFVTGRYHDQFAEAGHTRKQISKKIDIAFHQLFHGDPETQSVFFAAGKNTNGPLAYLTDLNNHDVRTEGMSYGMMIAVQLNKKKEFNALWNWAKTYMYISDPNHPSHGYFSWSCKTDGTPNEETAAPDGEEYFVMSLYFASNRWGNGTGIYDYKREADELLTHMRHRAEKSGPTRFGMRTVAAEVNEEAKMIRFVPSITRGAFTDPSYHLPAFYELWARWGPPADRDFWAQAAEASRAFFTKTTNPDTGLSPAYANFDGTPHYQPKYFSAREFHEGFAWVMTQKPWFPLGHGEYGVALFAKITFIDKSGREILRPFDAGLFKDFSQGLAALMTSDGFGYINTKGEWGIKPQFAEAGNFSEGLAAVKRQRLKQDDEFKYPKFTYPGWGYIDRNGTLVVPFQYYGGTDFRIGHACVKETPYDNDRMHWKVIDRDGNATPDPQKGECKGMYFSY